MPSSLPSTDNDTLLWYKNAVIYQAHVKSFYDASGDGIGDFRGLTEKLDYLAGLGVSAIWLLPFYPSPLKDDGYDVADYMNVNPLYGTIDDFKTFSQAAHARGLKIITDLVINHTSDQHAWFQRARRAPKGSPERAYYVWADDDKGYAGTRIIFCDVEKSNWTWDEVASQYYWHRFYSHQPDLNFDNPAILQEVLKIMDFWLGLGVDGVRLDAIPYLVEREGTNNESLPETHAVIKAMRAWMDAHYPGRLLLAEANQWPEKLIDFFGEGEGDECNMAFHFPLMPRLYLALAQEDRQPIIDIMRRTPALPKTGQWAIFLRNHDELTLEMVTEEERKLMWDLYAPIPRAQINLGIRRRLAPLLGNDRRKIEVLTALLMSMPGTPVIYYGDEIGMGDNIWLNDRDGVRTPMPWSSDRNAGFSRAAPHALPQPVVVDPVNGYQAVNVEAQDTTPGSLLNWTRALIQSRNRYAGVFGQGEQTFLEPEDKAVLAYLRTSCDETILVVANLSATARCVDLDLSALSGRSCREILGDTAFPPVTSAPYRLSLAPYGFFWLAFR